MDPISALLPRFGFEAKFFYSGEFCGATQFPDEEWVGHLHLVRKGPVIMLHDDGSELRIDVPTLVLYPRPYSHKLTIPRDAAAELLCATVAFREPQRNPLAVALPDYLQIPLADLHGLGATLSLLFEEASRNDSGRRFVMDRLCDILIVQLLRVSQQDGRIKAGALAGLADPGLARALQAIHAEPSRAWRVEDMAILAHMSRSKFAHVFHETVGVTPADYLNDWRMALAERLLRENNSVKSTAVAIGYSSQPAFTRAFIAKYGMPPKKWAKCSAAQQAG